MSAPKLPTWQDCHELWSKKRRRLQREQESVQNMPVGRPTRDGGIAASISTNNP